MCIAFGCTYAHGCGVHANVPCASVSSSALCVPYVCAVATFVCFIFGALLMFILLIAILILT